MPKKTPDIIMKAEPISISLPPYQLAGYRWNHPQQKKVMILHGFSSTIMKFDHFVSPLVKQGYEVIAVDAPAHGKSTGKQVSVLEYKAMIKKVNDAFGPMDAFIAHSFGGLALALYLSVNKHDENNKIVFIAPATETTTAISLFCKFLKIDASVRHSMEQHIFEKSGMQTHQFSISRVATSIKADTLWIHDEEDEITPWSNAKVVEQMQLPNYKFMLTKGLGHRKIYRDNQVKKSVFEFLK
jgi:alpha-beta hydrolase superfamily lysophospholipase